MRIIRPFSHLVRILTLFCSSMITVAAPPTDTSAAVRVDDASDGHNWPSYGRTYGEQHFSPLRQINESNVVRLGLAWTMELGSGHSVTVPLAVNGILYFSTGYSIVRAVEASSGKLLWVYDSKAAQAAGKKLRMGWGSRGIAWWNGRLFVGTHDGRLISLDAETGKPLWSVMTVSKDDYRFIGGAPRVFGGKVIIGHGGADGGMTRGYVTTYDAATGRQLWRFYTVPGNPADGFENEAMAMAAKTWSGQWWKVGGGGTVWNAFTYDPETDIVYLGTGNGSPSNHRIRSNGKGDNLFLSSVVALDASTGDYQWHYQTSPAEMWDYNAAMDMPLAELEFAGKTRKVLMIAPKNGFFYVIDRLDGTLLSAEPFVKVNWAKRIDIASGRPVEVPEARYPDGTEFTIWPGPIGAHASQAMAFSPITGLAYIPTIEMPATFSDKGITLENWTHAPGNAADGGHIMSLDSESDDPDVGTSDLLAWNPLTQAAAWRVPTPAFWNGGVLASAGNLVFQGQIDGRFNAYSADRGELLWSFEAHAPVTAAPITYTVDGKQHVTVFSGISGSGAVFGPQSREFIDTRTLVWRVMTFALDADKKLAKLEAAPWVAVADPSFVPDPAGAARGAAQYGLRCLHCHGLDVVSAGYAPDLRISAIPRTEAAFIAVVRHGSLVANGMPGFEELSDAQLADLRQYIRTEARKITTYP